MAEGFITRKGGVAATKAPSLNFVSKTDTEIVFTITNNDDATVDVFWELGDNTPDANQLELTAGQTSSNQTVSGLTAETQYTIFAFANKSGKAGSNTVSLTQTTDVNPYIEATGGTTTTYQDGGTFYKLHTFTSSGTFTVTKAGTGSQNELDYLIVAGGGGGGFGFYGGGGGAGGLIFRENQIVNPQSYTITVGAGGPSATDGSVNSSNGQNTTVFGLTALGGGGGSSRSTNNGGSDGGSGGGYAVPDAGKDIPGTGLQPTSSSGGFGNDGGSPDTNIDVFGTGGGGAGEPGHAPRFDYSSNQDFAIGAPGGDGLYYGNIFTNNYGEGGYFAGGGGGGARANNEGIDGGIGGGGSGSTLNSNQIGFSGQANTGGGGGGAGDNIQGGNGGSGIVIIRYEVGGL